MNLFFLGGVYDVTVRTYVFFVFSLYIVIGILVIICCFFLFRIDY